MLHACDQRFNVTGNLENFCELNKAWSTPLQLLNKLHKVEFSDNPSAIFLTTHLPFFYVHVFATHLDINYI